MREAPPSQSQCLYISGLNPIKERIAKDFVRFDSGCELAQILLFPFFMVVKSNFWESDIGRIF